MQSEQEDPSGFGAPAQSPAPARLPSLRVVLALQGKSLSAERITREHILRLRATLASTLKRQGLTPARVVVLTVSQVRVSAAAAAAAVRGNSRILNQLPEVQVTLQADFQDDAQAVAAQSRLTGAATAGFTQAAAAQLASAGAQSALLAEASAQAAPSSPPAVDSSKGGAAGSATGGAEAEGLSSGAIIGVSAIIALLTALVVVFLLQRRKVAPSSTPSGRVRRFGSFSSVHSVSTTGRGGRATAQPYLSTPGKGGVGMNGFKPLSQLER